MSAKLYLSFYRNDIDDNSLFTTLALHLKQEGHVPYENALIAHGMNASVMRFSSVYDLPFTNEKVPQDDIESILHNPDLRIVSLNFQDILGVNKTSTNELTYHGISQHAVLENDQHPVCIVVNGDYFTHPLGNVVHPDNRLRKRGGKVREMFLGLVKAVKPSYAAILIERPLKCISDLLPNEDDDIFYDFYISEQFMAPRDKSRILTKYPGLFIQSVEEGYYVSSCGAFNPQSVSLPNEDFNNLSADICNILINH